MAFSGSVSYLLLLVLVKYIEYLQCTIRSNLIAGSSDVASFPLSKLAGIDEFLLTKIKITLNICDLRKRAMRPIVSFSDGQFTVFV